MAVAGYRPMKPQVSRIEETETNRQLLYVQAADIAHALGPPGYSEGPDSGLAELAVSLKLSYLARPGTQITFKVAFAVAIGHNKGNLYGAVLRLPRTVFPHIQ